MDTVYTIPGEREFTPEEWDYYEELIRKHAPELREREKKEMEIGFIISNIGMLEKLSLEDLLEMDLDFQKRYVNDRTFRKKFAKKIIKRYRKKGIRLTKRDL